jgi:hypothetical protein
MVGAAVVSSMTAYTGSFDHHQGRMRAGVQPTFVHHLEEHEIANTALDRRELI